MNTVQPENVNSQNDTIEEVAPLEDNATDEQKAEYYAQLESSNEQLFARLKKAQGFVKKEGQWVKDAQAPTAQPPKQPIEVKTSDLSQNDLFALVKSGIEQEDIAEVVEYAKLKKISVSEALNAPLVKGILNEKAEQRRVADGTNTGAAKRGNAKVSDESLLENASQGKMPENDADIDRLVRLKLGIKS